MIKLILILMLLLLLFAIVQLVIERHKINRQFSLLYPSNTNQYYDSFLILAKKTVNVIFKPKEILLIRDQLTAAGFMNERTVFIYFFLKAVSLLLTALIFGIYYYISPPKDALSTLTSVILIVACIVIIPERVINSLARKTQKKFSASLINALDIIIICISSGATINESLDYAQQYFQLKKDKYAVQVFSTLKKDADIMGFEDAALRSLSKIKNESYNMFCTMFIGALKSGSPLSESLGKITCEFKEQDLAKKENVAGKISSLISLPLILLILFPTVVLIVAPFMVGIKNIVS